MQNMFKSVEGSPTRGKSSVRGHRHAFRRGSPVWAAPMGGGEGLAPGAGELGLKTFFHIYIFIAIFVNISPRSSK